MMDGHTSIVKAEPIGLVKVLGVEINKRGFKDDSQVFGLNNWQDGVAID